MRRYLELYIEKAFSVSQFTPVAVLVPVPDSGFPLFRTPFLHCSCFRALVCLFVCLFVCLIGWVLTQSSHPKFHFNSKLGALKNMRELLQ